VGPLLDPQFHFSFGETDGAICSALASLLAGSMRKEWFGLEWTGSLLVWCGGAAVWATFAFAFPRRLDLTARPVLPLLASFY
jgi:hypothetical protein